MSLRHDYKIKPGCCAERIHTGLLTSHACPRKGVLKEEGKLWCKQHAPSTGKAHRDKMSKRVDARMLALQHMSEVQRAEEAIIEAAKAFRRADFRLPGGETETNLLEAVKHLEKLESGYKSP